MSDAQTTVRWLIEQAANVETVVEDIPERLPKEFLVDCLSHAIRLTVAHAGDIATLDLIIQVQNGREHQEKMTQRWPGYWMFWVFRTIGAFGYDP